MSCSLTLVFTLFVHPNYGRATSVQVLELFGFKNIFFLLLKIHNIILSLFSISMF